MSSLLGKRYYETGANDDDEEDYLSDKFLAEIEQHEQKSKTSGSKTYAQLRKEAQKRKEDRGYIKPRAEREREAREEGLKRNLMTAVSSNPSASTSRDASNTPPPPTHGDNKALAMMIKMGFKPGEALGRKVDPINTKGKAKATQVMEDSADEEDGDGLAGLGARRGLGSSKRKAASPSGNEDFISLTDGLENSEDDGPPPTHAPKAKGSIPGHRIDPIEIQMRSGRPMFLSLRM